MLIWRAVSTLAIIGDKIKNGLNDPLWTTFIYFQKKYPRSMRLNFFDHRTLFLSPNRQFQSNCAHCLWAGSNLVIVGDKIKKNWLNEPLWTSFIFFQKKYPRSIRLNFFDHRTLFLSPNRQFQSNCAHCLWAGSNLAIIGDKIKNRLNEPLWTRFTYFQKSIRARWGLTFSITGQCFGHRIVNFSPIVLISGGQAPL